LVNERLFIICVCRRDLHGAGQPDGGDHPHALDFARELHHGPQGCQVLQYELCLQ
jgi:hypothetical protein